MNAKTGTKGRPGLFRSHQSIETNAPFNDLLPQIIVILSRCQESPREAQTRLQVSDPASNEPPRAPRKRLRRAIPRCGSE
jgi:hypothetical protein